VVGAAGSGKTTLARRLAERLGIEHVELDALFWGPDWTPVPLETFRVHVREALAGEAWTTDGNYSKARDLIWARADTLVWLDYPLPLVMWRVTTRTLRRSLTGEELWSGNRESLHSALFDEDSIVRYALKGHRRWRREYPALFREPEYHHLRVVRLQSARQTRRWITGVGDTSSVPAITSESG
jgi:adenylate kinase family enzyme